MPSTTSRIGCRSALDETRQIAPPSACEGRPAPGADGRAAPRRDRHDRAVLDRVFQRATASPEGFTIHPKLAKQFETRTKLYDEGEVDWATAESLALGLDPARRHRHPPHR